MPESSFDPAEIQPPAKYMRVLVGFRNVNPNLHIFVTHQQAVDAYRDLTRQGALLEEWMYYTQCVFSATDELEGEMDVRYSYSNASACLSYLSETHLGELGLLPSDFHKGHPS